MKQSKDQNQLILSSDFSEDLHVLSNIVDNEFIPKIHKLKFNPNIKYSFSLRKQEKLIDKLIDSIFQYSFTNDVFTTTDAKNLAPLIINDLNLKSNINTITNNLYPYFSTKVVNFNLRRQIMLRMVGNISILNNDELIPEGGTNIPIWAAVKVLGYEYTKKPSLILNLEIRDGIYAGYRFTHKFSNKFIKYVLTEIGFGKYTKTSPEDIFNTQWSVLFCLTKSALELREFHVSASQLKHNKILKKGRYQDRPCKEGNKHSDCLICPRGLDMCTLAIKPITKRRKK